MKYYITTPIYYINDKPHIGHAYTMILSDVAARWHRIKGDDVKFLTGTDENSKKTVLAAAKAGVDDIARYTDSMSAGWSDTWRAMNITYDEFIRTTEPRHQRSALALFHAAHKAGDIYVKKYQGLYCSGCEAYKTEKDLVDGLCPDHKRAPDAVEEENYFFAVTRYRDQLLAHIEQNPLFIRPVSRRNEVVNFIKDAMEDFSVSRVNPGIGIEIPQTSELPLSGQVLYVWFDALANYITACGYGTEDSWNKDGYWPASLHMMGKDIIKFHCAFWPAMLLSAGLPLPESVFAHGFFTVEGQKISKSLGNAVNPLDITSVYGNDALRWYLLSEITQGEDGEYSSEGLRQVYRSALSSGIGNCFQRVMTMVQKYCDGKIPEGWDIVGPSQEKWVLYSEAMNTLDFKRACGEVLELVKACDQYIDQQQPWALAKIDPVRVRIVLANLVRTLADIALMIRPLMPDTATRMLAYFGSQATEKALMSPQRATVHGHDILEPGFAFPQVEPLFPPIV